VHAAQDAVGVGCGRMHRQFGVPRVVDAEAWQWVFTEADDKPAGGEQVEGLRGVDRDLVAVPVRAVILDRDLQPGLRDRADVDKPSGAVYERVVDDSLT
jgi:hypothetical protein